MDAMLNHTGAGRLRSLGRVLVDLASCVRLNRFRGLASAAALEATAQALLRKNTLLASKYSVNTHAHKGSACVFLPKRVISWLQKKRSASQVKRVKQNWLP